MRSWNNDWETFIEKEAKQWRAQQEREKHDQYGPLPNLKKDKETNEDFMSNWNTEEPKK
jgi:hypothetical protein